MANDNIKKISLLAAVVFLFLYIIPTLSLHFFEKKYPLKNSEIEIKETDDLVISSDDFEIRYVQVYDINNNKVLTLEIEDYVMGVVSAEMPAEFESEALKAQAVAARTYLLYKLKKNTKNPEQHKDAPICTGIHCQVYYSKDELIEKFSQDWYNKYWDKIASAVNSTRGQILSYENKIIEPLFHSTSGGKTENSEDVFSAFTPYLRSVESPYEENSPKLTSSVSIPVSEFIQKLNDNFGISDLTAQNLKNKISLVDISEGGKIKSLQIGDKVLTGRDIRSLYNLNSAGFRFVQSNNTIEIITNGYGHGVGMSQYGANGMAIQGFNYEDILKHYYTGVDIIKYN